MSNIQELLNLIRTAIYGRDVRQAIHDAIRTCYDDGKAGAIDLQARELAALNATQLRGEMTAFETQQTAAQAAFEASASETIASGLESMETTMNTFIASHGVISATLITETTLYEADPASGPQASLNVTQEALATYDYVDIYYKIAGSYKRYARLTPDILAASFNLDPIAYSNGEKSLIMYEPVIEPNNAGTKLNLIVYRWAWNGAASAAATRREASEGATGIYKIVGVKHLATAASKDAELTDLRIAPDGTTYETAGAMIRGQLAAITARLDELGLYRDSGGDLCEEE